MLVAQIIVARYSISNHRLFYCIKLCTCSLLAAKLVGVLVISDARDTSPGSCPEEGRGGPRPRAYDVWYTVNSNKVQPGHSKTNGDICWTLLDNVAFCRSKHAD